MASLAKREGERVWFCLGEKTRGRGGRWLWLEKRSGQKIGGVASVVRDRFRFRVYYVSPLFQNYPPPLCMLWRPVFKGKILLGFQTWSLNFFLFFCKFVLSYIYGFFLSISTRMRKIGDFKI
jgi:hypothetical protein